MDFCKADLHIHTTASDGTDAPSEIIAKVKQAGITVFSVTDHDSADACAEVAARLQAGDPAFIFGVELSCRDEWGKYHVLGYGVDPAAPALSALLRFCLDSRRNRAQQRFEFLAREYGFTFSKEDTAAVLALPAPGKPHIANLMVRYGYAPTINAAIEEYLNHCHGSGRRIRPEEGIDAITQAGGIPVLAHPLFGSGAERVVGEELRERVARLTEQGIRGLECFYSAFLSEEQAEALSLAEQFDLYVTAGSDYHGANKRVRLGDTHLDSVRDLPQGFVRFLQDVSKVVK